MNVESKIKSVAAGVTVTLFATLIGTGILYRDNSLLTEDFKAEKVRTERLEAERSSLKNEIDKLKVDLSSFLEKNGSLDLALKDAQLKLSEREARVAQLTKENASLDQLKKENAAIRKIRQDLLTQLESLKHNNSNLQSEIADLNKTIAALRKENEALYAKAPIKSTMAYNFRTEVVKRRNERLTVRAKRTHHINISFDINSAAELPAKLYVKVQAPNNQEIKGELVMNESVVMQPELLTASLENGWIVAPEYRRISLSFDPNEKLEQGVYHVMVYSGNEYLGSTQFKLAK